MRRCAAVDTGFRVQRTDTASAASHWLAVQGQDLCAGLYSGLCGRAAVYDGVGHNSTVIEWRKGKPETSADLSVAEVVKAAVDLHMPVWERVKYSRRICRNASKSLRRSASAMRVEYLL